MNDGHACPAAIPPTTKSPERYGEGQRAILEAAPQRTGWHAERASTARMVYAGMRASASANPKIP